MSAVGNGVIHARLKARVNKVNFFGPILNRLAALFGALRRHFSDPPMTFEDAEQKAWTLFGVNGGVRYLPADPRSYQVGVWSELIDDGAPRLFRAFGTSAANWEEAFAIAEKMKGLAP
jgi:hypothetical protein